MALGNDIVGWIKRSGGARQPISQLAFEVDVPEERRQYGRAARENAD
jgi:hypothetical protein